MMHASPREVPENRDGMERFPECYVVYFFAQEHDRSGDPPFTTWTYVVDSLDVRDVIAWAQDCAEGRPYAIAAQLPTLNPGDPIELVWVVGRDLNDAGEPA